MVDIACNKILLLLQAQKLDVAKKDLEKLRQSYPDHPRVALVQAAIAHREKKNKVCEEVLQTYLASRPDDAQVLLPLAQLYTQQHRHEAAVEALAKRQDRHRIVVAQQTTPLATVRAAFKGKSLLEERWIGNLDDSEADTEMSLPAVLAWFRRTEIYKHTLLTDAEVVDYIQQMLSGRRVAAIVSVANRRSNAISPVQFQALVHWIAQHKGITFSECISKLVNHRGFMTVYEFTRFCKVFGLFKLTPGRFVEGDVQFLFTVSGEGKAVDLEGFRRVLGQARVRSEEH
eukprot:g20650.t1